MPPPTPPLLNPDPGLDAIGLFITVIVPTLMTLLVSSDKARQVAQGVLSLYNVYKGFRDRVKRQSKSPPAPVSNGNGNGHSNGNGNGASELMKSVLQNLRVEADARESGDERITLQLREVTERGRRDSDNFYMLYTELTTDAKAVKQVLDTQGNKIISLEAEQIAVRNQVTQMVQEQRITNQTLQSILHLLDPNTPPMPPGDVIPLDHDEDLLEASGQ